MKQQNYSNHSKMVLGFHGILFVAIVALLIGAIRNLIKAIDEDIYGASLLVLIPLIFLTAKNLKDDLCLLHPSL